MRYTQSSKSDTFGFEAESKCPFDFSREPETPYIDYEPAKGENLFEEMEFRDLLQRIAKTEGKDVAIKLRRHRKAYVLCKYLLLMYEIDDERLDEASIHNLRRMMRGAV